MTDYKSPLGHKRQLPSGRWQVEVMSGYRADGQRRRVAATVDTEEEADAKIVELAAELGKSPEFARGITLASYWSYYGATKGKRLAKATYQRYEGCMRRRILPLLGSKDISKLSHSDVQAVVLGCETRSEGDQVRRSLSAVLGQAVSDGALQTNPCRGKVELPSDEALPLDYEGDPFAAIEGTSNVWTPQQVLQAMPLLEGTSYETVWLVMIGAGLRLEEAMALRWADVRRVEISGRNVVQVAVWRAKTYADGMKSTKTKRSVRIVAVSEPFASRLWELKGSPEEQVVPRSVSNISQGWRRLWLPVTSAKARKKDRIKGIMVDGVEPPIPYIPLSRMRATHASMMQAAGVIDSLNAAAHGHSQKVSYKHYQRADTVNASVAVAELLDFDAKRHSREAR